MAEPAGPMAAFRRRYLLALAAVGWMPAAVVSWKWGGRAGLACLLTAFLVGADFYWLSRSFGPLFAPGASVPKGAGARATLGLLGRMALLLIGLYAILRVLPGQSGAVAAGLAAPLFCVALAGAAAAAREKAED